MLSLNTAVNATIKTHLYATKTIDKVVSFFYAPKCNLCKGMKNNLGHKTNPPPPELYALEPALCGACLCKFRLFFTRTRWRTLNRYKREYSENNISEARHIDIVEWVAHLLRAHYKPKWLTNGHVERTYTNQYTKGQNVRYFDEQ